MTWAKESPAAFLPHLEGLAGRAKELWEGGRIRAGERNAISEAILQAAVAGPEALQRSVSETASPGCRRTGWLVLGAFFRVAFSVLKAPASQRLCPSAVPLRSVSFCCGRLGA